MERFHSFCREILLTLLGSQREVGSSKLRNILALKQGFLSQGSQDLMHITYNGSSYNMSTSQNPSTDIPHLQKQITQLTLVLEQINHKFDAMENFQARNKFKPHKRRREKRTRNLKRGTGNLVIVEVALGAIAMNFQGDKDGTTLTITLSKN